MAHNRAGLTGCRFPLGEIRFPPSQLVESIHSSGISRGTGAVSPRDFHAAPDCSFRTSPYINTPCGGVFVLGTRSKAKEVSATGYSI